MAGIAGFITDKEDHQGRERLPGMLIPLRTGNADLAGQAFLRFGGIGCIDPPATENRSLIKKGNVILTWTGYIAQDYHLSHQLRHIPNLDPNQSLTGQLIDLYLHLGIQALHDLNGQYTIVIWDSTWQMLKVINDRFGLQPFYYWDSGHMLVFGSAMRAIARFPDFPKDINPAALFDLLATGQMLGEHTLFQSISTLPPASELTYQSGNLTIAQYWQPTLYQPGGQTVPSAMYIKQFGDLIQAAVSRHTRPGSCLLLTGGLSSRWLAGSMVNVHGHGQFQANTIGHDQARDALIAQDIAQTLDLHHQIIPVNRNYLTDYAQTCIRRTEGVINITDGWLFGETEFIRQNNIRQIVTGMGAKLISGRHWLAEQPQLSNSTKFDPDAVVQLLCTRCWQFDQAATLMSAAYRQTAPAASQDFLRNVLLSAPCEEPYSRYDYLYIVQQPRRPTGYLLAPDAAVQEPFFDNDLVDFALSMPAPLRQYLYKKALATYFPNLAEIETTDRGISVAAELQANKSDKPANETLWGRALQKLRQPNPIKATETNAGWQTVDPDLWMRTDSKDLLIQLSKRIDRMGKWIDIAAAQRLIEDHLSGRVQASRLIGGLLTADLWLEMAL